MAKWREVLLGNGKSRPGCPERLGYFTRQWFYCAMTRKYWNFIAELTVLVNVNVVPLATLV